MEGVRASCGMLHIVLPTKLSLRGELYSTVVEEGVLVDFGIVLKGNSEDVTGIQYSNEGGHTPIFCYVLSNNVLYFLP